MFSSFASCAASLFLLTASAKVVSYDFTASWVMANPDGMMERRVIGLNGQWPIPLIEVDMGDNVLVNLHNELGDEETSLHFHGLFQNGTTHMDGPVAVSQCAVLPGRSFTYNFTVDQPGTYWYHSHVRGQYPDGLRGPMIVRDPTSPYINQYDGELIMTLSDWYHDEMPLLLAKFMSVSNPTGAEPVPDSALMNDRQNTPFNVLPGKTYLIRIVNMAAFAPQYFWFEGHTMEIVEVDGVWTERAETNMLYVAPAQRYSVLLKTKDTADENFAVVGSMDQDVFDKVPPGLNPNVTGHLVYDDSKPMSTPVKLDVFDPHDDFDLVPTDGEELWNDPVQTWTLDMKMDNLGDGQNYAFFNDITWIAPKVPTLYTALTTGQDAMNREVYGINTNSFTLGHNEVFEMVLNNADPGKHPFHLHGHTFQTLVRANDDAGAYDASNHTAFPTVPMRRDTLLVRPNSHFVIRFRSDNPGVWLFHCHLEWHVASGLIATIIEAPLELQKQLSIDRLPANHIQACKDTSTPMYGNAAGNTENFLDLTGQNLAPAPLPAGFEPRGIVALTFSIVAAFLGMASVAWYGAKPLSEKEEEQEEKKLAVGVGASVSKS